MLRQGRAQNGPATVGAGTHIPELAVAENAFKDPFQSLSRLDLREGPAFCHRLGALEEAGLVDDLAALPFAIRVLLENVLRHLGGSSTLGDVEAVAAWSPRGSGASVPFMPSRVVLQDFTGVPAVVDLAAMRDGILALGGDPAVINPVVPVDLVIDHSVQVDHFGFSDAFRLNVEREFERNRERYALLRWAQQAFDNFTVVPPGTGIVHQVNLEYLASVVHRGEWAGAATLYPDTLVGTDSHTTMVNGLGVLGWGVGGIEAEAVMLGQPYYMLLPEVVGLRLSGSLPRGATATDLVLRVTELLREHGVVGRFVEYHGPGLAALTLPDRATLANMSPEYGATVGFFPVDEQTLTYLRGTGRSAGLVERVERASKEMGLYRTEDAPDPEYSSALSLDLGTVEPSLAGPRRPQDRILMTDMREAFARDLPGLAPSLSGRREGNGAGMADSLAHGSVVIASITSCTNTSNPSVMVGAGLLAKAAVERGLGVAATVKTAMAPGSGVVTDYLRKAGLLPYLEELGFHVVGYGCMTCIGNSGPLPDEVARAVEERGLVVASVLSGNRNFEARIHPMVRANYLASPVLVVAYALAGRVDVDLAEEPLGEGADGGPVYLRDIWPSQEAVSDTISAALDPSMFVDRYASVGEGDENWRALPVPEEGSLFDWEPDSTYVRNPPFFDGLQTEAESPADILGARVLAVLGSSVTTDHISPAGAIPLRGPAGVYLRSLGVAPRDFNTFGARRGNHEVMMRGTFANVRIRNLLLDGREGGYTIHLPTGEEVDIYEAARRYRSEGVPLVVLAGAEYGAGSSRDWAAKGTALLGVRAVIAESYERIHRSNLVGMGVLPLEFPTGEGLDSLGLTGREEFDVLGIAGGLAPGAELEVRARSREGGEIRFQARARLDSDVDVRYYEEGGILSAVLREMTGARGRCDDS